MSIKFKFILWFILLLLAGIGMGTVISFEVVEQAMVASTQIEMGHAIQPDHARVHGQTFLTGVRFMVGMTLLVTLLVSVAAVWFLVRRMTRGLQALTHSVRNVSDGNPHFNVSVEEKSHDELGVLVRAFNRMLQTLKTTMDSKEVTENMLGAMLDGLLVLDHENRVQRVNRAMLDILGEKEENLIGVFLDQLLPDHTFSAIMFRDLLSDRPFRAQETIFKTKDGGDIPVSISCNLIQKENSVMGTILLVQDLRSRKDTEEQLHFLANFDVLTKLPNRTLLMDRLTHELSRAPWRGKNVGTMHCALDRFNEMNDTLGHSLGDEILKETADRLRACIRDGDTVARVGGDEFIIAFVDMAKSEDITRLADKIAREISLPLILSNGQEVFVTASIGISLFPGDGPTPDELLKNAYIATHFAKAQGKNQYRFFSNDMNKKGELRLGMESDLRRAIERGELEPHYQPRWDLKEDRMVGAEALVRWRRGGTKLVSPADFLPLAEELGLIESIDLWMLQRVCQQARTWLDAGYSTIRISVNLSQQIFQREDLVETIDRILDETKLESDSLELELTEAIIMRNVTHSMNSLKVLRNMWIHLAVDDFGTGYSTFSHLRRLPLHVLKIDRSFIREITSNHEDSAITHAIINMAHTLKLRTTAEGVEEQAQRDLLTELGCDEMQGYLISRPLPAEEFEAKFLVCHPWFIPPVSDQDIEGIV